MLVTPQRIGQMAVWRAQIPDFDSLILQPFGRHAGGQHQRPVRGALEGEHVESGLNEVRRDPGMRHVPNETRLAQIAADHFSPLIPAGGPAVFEEKVEELLHTFTPSQPHKGPRAAQFVRCVLGPLPVAVAALREFLPIAFESLPQLLLRKFGLFAGDRQGDGGRGGIEIPAICAGGNVVDAVLLDARLQRRMQIKAELIVAGGKRAGFRTAERPGDVRGTGVTGQAPEVVPVRIGGPIRITFVADGGRHQSKQCAPLRRLVLRRALRCAQQIHVRGCRSDVRPHFAQPCAVMRVAIALCDQVDEFSLAVVFRYRIRAAAVDAARHFTVGKLMRGEPVGVFAHDVRVTQAQQCVGHHRAVAYP